MRAAVQVPGTVIRTGQIKMLQSKREYVCLKCKQSFSVSADIEQVSTDPGQPI